MLYYIFFYVCLCLNMCLHLKTVKTVKNDLLDRPIVHSDYCTFTDNCDYVSVENQLLIDDTDLTIL